MIKCSKCGTELEPHAKFCTNCGEKVSLEMSETIMSKKPVSNLKIWLFKSIAFFIAFIVFGVARLIFIVANGADNDKITIGGILLFYGVYNYFSGIFLKDNNARKRGGWAIFIYLVASIIFSYFLNNSSLGIDEAIRKSINATPIKIDEDTELSKISMNGNNVIFKYKLLNIAKDDIPYANLQDFKQTIKNESCKDKDFIRMMKYEKSIRIYYYGKQDKEISNIVISNKECR